MLVQVDNFDIKFISAESPVYSQSNAIIFLKINQTFINKNSHLKKSFQICFAIKWSTLDWTSYAITLGARQSRKEGKIISVIMTYAQQIESILKNVM